MPVRVCQSAIHGDKDQQCKACKPDDVPVLVSGAGHDSLAMAELTQASAVLLLLLLLAEGMTKRWTANYMTALTEANCSVQLSYQFTPIAKVPGGCLKL